MALVPATAQVQYAQQAKLVGNQTVGTAWQGYSVALSYNGDTLIAGGPSDNGGIGAAWVFTRTGNTWTQQAKLVDPTAVGAAQGTSVAISDDGNTALVGGPGDSSSFGAVWVWVRNGTNWSIEQKLFDDTASPGGMQGQSVSLTADGVMAMVGGPADGVTGSVWFYAKVNNVWTLESKQSGGDALASRYGWAVGISRDGMWAAAGAPLSTLADSAVTLYGPGAPWPASNTYSGPSLQALGNSIAFSGTHLLFGAPLANSVYMDNFVPITSTHVPVNAAFGFSIATSGDGTIAVIGAPGDNSRVGSTLVYQWSNGAWVEQPNKLAASDTRALQGIPVQQGQAVAISGNGTTIAVGGYGDSANAGATWIYTQGPDFGLSISHTDPFHSGQTNAAYHVSVFNGGTASSTGLVTVTLTVPSQAMSPVSLSGTGWACSTATLTCTADGSLQPGASLPDINLIVSVNPNVAGAYDVQATLAPAGSEINPSNDSATSTTNIVGTPDLTIATSCPKPIAPGDRMDNFNLTVTNAGNAPTTGVVSVTDILPPGLMGWYVAGSGWTCAQPVGPCTRSDVLAPGASYPPITFTVFVTGFGPTMWNTATVSVAGDANLANNTSTADLMLAPPTPDLSIALSHTGNFTAGGTGAYSILVTNHGGAATTASISVTDHLPAGFTLAATPVIATWDCSASTASTLSCTRAQALASGNSAAIAFTINIAANAASTTNSATVSGGGDQNLADNTASDPTTVVSNSTITVSIGTNVWGFSFSIDGVTYTTPQVVSWAPGSQHTIATTSPQFAGRTFCNFVSWSDGGAISHTVTADPNVTSYIATFN